MDSHTRLGPFAALLIVLLTGCSFRSPAGAIGGGPAIQVEPVVQEPVSELADRSATGAKLAVEQYLAARQAQDYRKVYRLLSARSQGSYRQADLERFFANQVSYSYEQLGAGTLERDGTWMRWNVRGVQWTLQGRAPMKGEDWYVTVHYDQGRWGVALSTPLFDRGTALQFENRGRDLSLLADQMISIDPWDFRGHLHKAYALIMLQNAERAVASLTNAYDVAPAELQPEVTRVYAELLRSVGRLQSALEAYQVTLQAVTKHVSFYEAGFEAVVRRGLADVYQAAGQRDAALKEAIRSELLQPAAVTNHVQAISLALP